jgi:hypothetical protein
VYIISKFSLSHFARRLKLIIIMEALAAGAAAAQLLDFLPRPPQG